jgi:hypothetical protein
LPARRVGDLDVYYEEHGSERPDPLLEVARGFLEGSERDRCAC